MPGLPVVGLGLFGKTPGAAVMGVGAAPVVPEPDPVLFFDDFTRDDGAIGNDWIGSTFTVVSNKVIGTPTTGIEVLTNGNMAAWAAAPTGWTVNGASAPNREVTQVAPENGHGEGGTGAANLFTDSTTAINLRQAHTYDISKFYRGRLNITTYTGGDYLTYQWGQGTSSTRFTTAGVKTCVFPGGGVAANFQITGINGDFTVDDISLIDLILSSQMAFQNVALDDFGMSVYIEVPLGFMGGLAMFDSPDNPQNGVVAYVNFGSAASTAGMNVIIDKYVGGVRERLLSTNVTIDATSRKLELIRIGTSYTVRHNGSDVTTQTIADAAITACEYFGLFSTDPSILFNDFTLYDIPEVTAAFTFDNDWITPGAELTTLVEHPSVTNPVLDKDDVPGSLRWVADPFVVLDGETYYMFYEIAYDPTGAVYGYATSPDGLAWTHTGIVQGMYNMGSYPYVFRSGGRWWMIGEYGKAFQELHMAIDFPSRWGFVKKLTATQLYNQRDATIFKWGAKWYIFVCDDTGGLTRIFMSDTLTGTYAEHPASPLNFGVDIERPAGRPILRATTIDLMIQDGHAYYGQKVRVFTITTLSATECVVSESAISPILDETLGGAGTWNDAGHHSIDRINGGLCIVDASNAPGAGFSIGVMRDGP